MKSKAIHVYEKSGLTGHISGDRLILHGEYRLGAGLIMAQASMMTVSIHKNESGLIGNILCCQRQQVRHDTRILFAISNEQVCEQEVNQIACVQVLEITYPLRTKAEVSGVQFGDVCFSLERGVTISAPAFMLEEMETMFGDGILIFSVFTKSGYAALLVMKNNDVPHWIIAPLAFISEFQEKRQAALLLDCADFLPKDSYHIEEILFINTSKVSILDTLRVLRRIPTGTADVAG